MFSGKVGSTMLSPGAILKDNREKDTFENSRLVNVMSYNKKNVYLDGFGPINGFVSGLCYEYF